MTLVLHDRAPLSEYLMVAVREWEHRATWRIADRTMPTGGTALRAGALVSEKANGSYRFQALAWAEYGAWLDRVTGERFTPLWTRSQDGSWRKWDPEEMDH